MAACSDAACKGPGAGPALVHGRSVAAMDRKHARLRACVLLKGPGLTGPCSVRARPTGWSGLERVWGPAITRVMRLREPSKGP